MKMSENLRNILLRRTKTNKYVAQMYYFSLENVAERLKLSKDISIFVSSLETVRPDYIYIVKEESRSRNIQK